MKLKLHTDIDLPADKVWELVGEKFGENGKWTSLLDSSYLEGLAEVGGQRVCKVDDKILVERITRFDAGEMTIEYELTEGRPVFVAFGRNRWIVQSLGPNKSRVAIHPWVGLKWWAIFLFPLMSIGLKGDLAKVLEEFKFWAETGEAHPRKLAKMS